MFEQVKLGYAADGLEPQIDKLTIETHYGKHHALYTKNLNDAAEKAGVADKDIEELLASLDSVTDEGLRKDALKEELTKLALGQFGSGWAWLSANKNGDLMVSASPNQDNPISEETGFIPILAIDVWEHAYYLSYKNLRADYVSKLFEIMDWKLIEANYQRVKG